MSKDETLDRLTYLITAAEELRLHVLDDYDKASKASVMEVDHIVSKANQAINAAVQCLKFSAKLAPS